MLPADMRLRKRALAVVALTLLAGIVYVMWFQAFLRDLAALETASPALALEKLAPVRTVLLTVVLGATAALAGLFASVALKIVRTGQWPPPGWRMIWQTPIRTGRQATRMAALFVLLAVLTIAYGVVLGSFVWPRHDLPGEPPRQAV